MRDGLIDLGLNVSRLTTEDLVEWNPRRVASRRYLQTFVGCKFIAARRAMDECRGRLDSLDRFTVTSHSSHADRPASEDCPELQPVANVCPVELLAGGQSPLRNENA